jgi:alpha-L-rhamnosidase
LDKPVKQATVSIIGLGLYDLYLNGQRAGYQVLAPVFAAIYWMAFLII